MLANIKFNYLTTAVYSNVCQGASPNVEIHICLRTLYATVAYED